MKAIPLLIASILGIGLRLDAADPTRPKPERSYEEQEAESKAFYEKQLPSLPPGTIAVVDQVYVDCPAPKGISPGSSQKLDLFVPPGSGPYPVIVHIHGGGWHSGDKKGGASMAKGFLPKGIATASIDYRWVQDAPFPAQIEDCNAALTWLRTNAAKYHLDPNRMIVAGHSAGGHLCALITTTGDGTTFKNAQKVQGAVCMSGVFDMDRERGNWPKNSVLYNPRDPLWPFFPNRAYDGAFARYASPQSYIHSGIPPTLVIHGDNDTLVPIEQAKTFADGLKKAGIDSTFLATAGRGHGNVMDEPAKAEMIAFLVKHLLH